MDTSLDQSWGREAPMPPATLMSTRSSDWHLGFPMVAATSSHSHPLFFCLLENSSACFPLFLSLVISMAPLCQAWSEFQGFTTLFS